MLRLTFGELLDDQPRYHSAITITAQNAAEFAVLIYKFAEAAIAPTIPVADPTESPNG